MSNRIGATLALTAAITASMSVAMTSAVAVAPSFGYTVHVGAAPAGHPVRAHTYAVGSPPQFQLVDTATGTTITCNSTSSDPRDGYPYLVPGSYDSADAAEIHAFAEIHPTADCGTLGSGVGFYLRITSETTSPEAFRGVGRTNASGFTLGDGCTFTLTGTQDFKFANAYSTISFYGKSTTTPLTVRSAHDCGSEVARGDAFSLTGVFKLKAAAGAIAITSP